MSQPASTVVSVRRWRTEIFVSWFAATVGVSIGWLAVLMISFPVLLPLRSTGRVDLDNAAVCGTVLRPKLGIPGCAHEVSDQRWFIVALLAVAVASFGVSWRYGRRSIRGVRWTSTVAVAVCVTLAAAALTGTLAISNHYGEFYYGDSAWTDRLDFNPLHETAYYGGIALLVFTVPTAVFLGVGRLLFPRSPA
jgi:hypothetical protein